MRFEIPLLIIAPKVIGLDPLVHQQLGIYFYRISLCHRETKIRLDALTPHTSH